MKKRNNVITIIAIILLIAIIGVVVFGIYKRFTTEVKNPIATMEVEGFGTIKLELYPDIAPNTVTNFIALANRGFYDGLTFHRTIPDFMIQGGDKNGDGTGSPSLSDIMDNVEEDKEYSIAGEFQANGFKNDLKHEKGVISMARSDYSQYESLAPGVIEEGYNSAGSQFFIMTDNNTSLDGSYAAFGKVIEGMDVVEAIANVEVETRDENAESGLDRPVNPPVIKRIYVDTFGVDYGMPETRDTFDYSSIFNQLNTSGSSNTTTEGETTETEEPAQ